MIHFSTKLIVFYPILKTGWYIENDYHSVIFLIEDKRSHRFGKYMLVSNIINDIL